ncbi:MAG: E3 ubiquitin ligase family protein [Gammaproteobacteria bacterium]|nr:E3 ubiquitin ligase family protein [Gammaproteobacteria bacterium]
MNILQNLFNPVALRQEIIQASAQEFWFHAAIIVAITAAGFYFTLEFFKRARTIEDTPTSRIRSAAQGYVELVGYGDTMDGPAIVAPLSKIPCTWYKYKVEKLADKHDEVIDSGASSDLFVLVGKTGRCVIDPEGAIVTPTVKRVWYGAKYEGADGDSVLGGFGRRYRFTEERMHPGDALYAIGLFRSVGGHNEAFNTAEEVRALLKKWKQDQEKLLKHFDKNKDGRIDAHEWENVRKVAAYFVRKKQMNEKPRPVTHIMSKPENTRQLYLLSNKPQHELIKRYKIYAASSFAGFLGAGSFAAWMFLVRF